MRRHRVHLPNQGELEAARKVLAEIKPQTLSEYLGKPASSTPKYDYAAPEFVNPKSPVSALDFKDPLQFWDLLSAAMNENPPPKAEIEALLPMYKPLGLELGKQWDRSKVDPVVLKSMARAAQAVPFCWPADQRVVHSAAYHRGFGNGLRDSRNHRAHRSDG